MVSCGSVKDRGPAGDIGVVCVLSRFSFVQISFFEQGCGFVHCGSGVCVDSENSVVRVRCSDFPALFCAVPVKACTKPVENVQPFGCVF